MPHPDQLTIAASAVRILPAQVRSNGTYQRAEARQPALWMWETQGHIVSLAEAILLLPIEQDLSCLLDIWPLKSRKVLSVSWYRERPWVPPRVIAFQQGDWIQLLRLETWGFR